MKECTKCGETQDDTEFESNRPYDRKRGITTSQCKTCRAKRNTYMRNWYATSEKQRIDNPIT